MSSVAVAVLAAGRGERFGGDVPKPLVLLRGRPLVAYALDAARASGCAPLIVVVSDARVIPVVAGNGVTTVVNETPQAGIASSLQCALDALDAHDGASNPSALVVGLADQPLVGAEAYRRLAAVDAPLAYATYSGVRGNPVRIGREYFQEARGLEGDEGARVLFRTHDARAVPCDGTGSPDDVDTPDDLARLEQRWRSQTASE